MLWLPLLPLIYLAKIRKSYSSYSKLILKIRKIVTELCFLSDRESVKVKCSNLAQFGIHVQIPLSIIFEQALQLKDMVYKELMPTSQLKLTKK